MKVAVLSGKGGTGKTFISVNLAAIIEGSTYIDSDVEEPNGHLFFKPEIEKRESVYVMLPKFDMDKCIGCKACVDFCQFNALALVGNQMLVFDEVCHSCGGCSLICKHDAIREVQKEIGHIEVGDSFGVRVISGRMNIGEASGVPIIDRLNQMAKMLDKDVFIDCPPGSACVVMESIKEADYCVIAAEPSVYGVHNMAMVVELVKKFKKPFGIVVNKHIDGDNPLDQFCKDNQLKVIGQIPYDDGLAEMNSKGLIPASIDPRFKLVFEEIFQTIEMEVTS